MLMIKINYNINFLHIANSLINQLFESKIDIKNNFKLYKIYIFLSLTKLNKFHNLSFLLC